MGIFTKTAEYFKDRLGKTRDKISSSLTSVLTFGRDIDEELLDKLEDTLISDDIGVETTEKLISDLRAAYRNKQIAKTEDIISFLKEHIKGYWPDRHRELCAAKEGPTVILVAGVNGSGKTTSIAKLAYILSRDNKKVIVAALLYSHIKFWRCPEVSLCGSTTVFHNKRGSENLTAIVQFVKEKKQKSSIKKVIWQAFRTSLEPSTCSYSMTFSSSESVSKARKNSSTLSTLFTITANRSF